MLAVWAFWSPFLTFYLMSSSLFIGCQLPAFLIFPEKEKCSVCWMVSEGDKRGVWILAVYG